MTWDEREHPRDRYGRFIEKADWASIVADRAGGVLGPQGEFDSGVFWRAYPSMLAPDLIPGDDSRDATMQARRAEEEWGGLGQWWWAPGQTGEGFDVGFYGGTKGMVLVGVRMRSGRSSLIEPRGHSGDYATEPTEVAVVSMSVWEDGWHPILVPPGLVTRTHRSYGD